MSSSIRSLLSSSLLLASSRLIDKSIGVISTLILARILTPDDFGIVAITSIVVQFFAVLGVTGGEQYIIQKQSIAKNDVDTAWTLDIVLKIALWMMLWALAEVISDLFSQTDVTMAIRALSLILLIEALQNPGLILQKRRLEYGRIFRLNVVTKVISTGCLITLALATRSYWALIIGSLLSATIMTLGSYIASSFRPKLSLSQFSSQIGFSQWMLLRSMLGYTRSHIDNLFASNVFGSVALGKYYISRDIALLPADQLIHPLTEPLLASFASLKGDHLHLGRQFRISILVVLVLILPVAAYIAAFPEPIIDTLLGDQWRESYSVFSAFALLVVSSALAKVIFPAVVALKRVKFLFLYDVLSFFVLLGGLLVINPETLRGLALATGSLSLASVLLMALCVNTFLEFNPVRTLAISFPFAAASFIASNLAMLITYPHNPVLHLLFSGSLFVSIYTIFCFSTLYLASTRISEYKYILDISIRLVGSIVDTGTKMVNRLR